MPTFEAKVGPGGTVEIPQPLRERLRIVEGTVVEFFLTVDGQVHFHAITGECSDWGIPGRLPPISVREMDDAIADHIVEDWNRIDRGAHKPKTGAAAE